MLEQFERFTKSGRSYAPKVSIRKRGQIGFNSGAVERFGLREKDFAVLYMSKDKTQMAIRFTNDQAEQGAIKITKKSGNYFIPGKVFFDYYGIDYSVEYKKSYDADWHPAEQSAIITLKKVVDPFAKPK